MQPYIIVTASDISTLIKEVNKKILEGYEPIGGVSVGVLDGYQAMYNPKFKELPYTI